MRSLTPHAAAAGVAAPIALAEASVQSTAIIHRHGWRKLFLTVNRATMCLRSGVVRPVVVEVEPIVGGYPCIVREPVGVALHPALQVGLARAPFDVDPFGE